MTSTATMRLEENFSRQSKALALLLKLLEEEFSRLSDRNAKGVSSIELPIQELMRQIAAERTEILLLNAQIAEREGARMVDVLPLLDVELAERIQAKLTYMDGQEQACARQAAKNQHLAMALYEQSHKLLEFMHNKIKPSKIDGYSAGGKYTTANGSGSLVRGRL